MPFNRKLEDQDDYDKIKNVKKKDKKKIRKEKGEGKRSDPEAL